MKTTKYLVFDVGCIECGESSKVVGIYATKQNAQRAVKRYITYEPNKFGTYWGRKEWTGQHEVEIYEVKI